MWELQTHCRTYPNILTEHGKSTSEMWLLFHLPLSSFCRADLSNCSRLFSCPCVYWTFCRCRTWNSCPYTEIEICSDHNLATLEADMANAYYQVLDQLDQSEKADFRRAHFDWFNRYQNTCNVEEPGSQNLKNCISREMVEHTNELKSRLNLSTEISGQQR